MQKELDEFHERGIRDRSVSGADPSRLLDFSHRAVILDLQAAFRPRT